MNNLYREALAKMSPEEIVEAYRSGRIDAVLHGERQPEPPIGDTAGNLRREDLAKMAPEEIVEAKRAGRLDALLRGEPEPEPSTTDDSEHR